MRVVHYVNQFFGGIGGDDQAGHAPELRGEAVGPGRLLNSLLGEDGSVVATFICGDRYFQDKTEIALDAFRQALDDIKPDIVIAGPAFDSPRYGYACAEIVKAAESAGTVALAGMHPENLAAPAYAPQIYISATGASPASMADSLANMVKLARKLTSGEAIGSAADEGFLSRDGSEEDVQTARDELMQEIQGGVLEVGGHPSEFTLTVAGKDEQAALSEALQKGPVLVSIYKSSCQASKAAFPIFERLTHAYPEDRLTVWGVSLDSPRVTASFQRRYGITFPILLDEDGYPTAASFGVKETPSTFLINQSGEVVWNATAFDKSEMSDLSDRVAGLLSEPAADILSGTEDVPDSVHG